MGRQGYDNYASIYGLEGMEKIENYKKYSSKIISDFKWNEYCELLKSFKKTRRENLLNRLNQEKRKSLIF
jgi:hypothetical protein